MADTEAPKIVAPPPNGAPNGAHTAIDGTAVPPRPKRTPLHQLYRQPVPLRTFPLPTFFPANPLSLLHIAYVWIQQVVLPPPAEPAVIYTGVWSEETRSVHVLDRRDMEALWYNGFFGKGSLSRSEPTWKKRKMAEISAAAGNSAEQAREKRRDDRHVFKWERARLEQMAIESARLAEGASAEKIASPHVNGQPQSPKPTENGSIGANGRPAEAHGDKLGGLASGSAVLSARPKSLLLTPPASPVTPMALLKLPNSVLDPTDPNASRASDSLTNGTEVTEQTASSIMPIPLGDITHALGKPMRVSETNHDTSATAQTDDSQSIDGEESSRGLKRQKSVRFSPTVESTTFRRTDPPSPNYSPPTQPQYPNASEAQGLGLLNGQGSPSSAKGPPASLPAKQEDTPAVNEMVVAEPEDIPDREHLQLSLEEAFFLTFGIGALSVTNPADGSKFFNEQLFALFRQHSRISPQMPSSAGVSQDDPFLIRYAVYHRYRSLGWVVRDGIKFGVDLLLYLKGPVFSHAEFGLVIMPPNGDRSWHWQHAVNRTLATVFKSFVLVYVNFPSDGVSGVEDEGVAGILQRYRIQEIPVKRWSSNRNR